MNVIQQVLFDNIPCGYHYQNNWYLFNCPCCHFNGQSRPDVRRRGALMFTTEGGFAYHCFNCKHKVSWSPGRSITKKIEQFLKYMNVTTEQLKECYLYALTSIETLKKEGVTLSTFKDDLKGKTFPSTALPLKQVLLSENPPSRAIDAAMYLYNVRSKFLLDSYEFYWTHEMENYILMPAKYRQWTYGYSARYIGTPPNNNTPRYINNTPQGFIFNADNLDNPHRKYVILVEGTLDAIAIDGCGIMTSILNERQLLWVKEVAKSKKIIVLPDRDKDGKFILQQAIQNGWSVSFPTWDRKIKDAEDATHKYGRLFTVSNILNSTVDTDLEIKIRAMDWFGV